MADDIRYSLSPLSDEPYDNGMLYEDPGNDPKQNYAPPPNATNAEIHRLSQLLYTRKLEFKKANLTRWLLTTIGFAVTNFLIMFAIVEYATPDYHVDEFGIITETPISTEIFVAMLLIAVVVAVFHVFINASLFGWLFQKKIAEDRGLYAIIQQMNDLKNKTN